MYVNKFKFVTFGHQTTVLRMLVAAMCVDTYDIPTAIVMNVMNGQRRRRAIISMKGSKRRRREDKDNKRLTNWKTSIILCDYQPWGKR